MEKLVCAVFDDEERAAKAVERVVRNGIDPKVVSALLHEGELRHEDLGLAETKSARRGAQGTILCATIGAAVGAILGGPIGLLGLGPLAAALAGAGAGGFYGALAGAISGRDAPKDAIEQLQAQLAEGKVLVTVDVEEAHADAVARVLQSHGGRRLEIA